MYEATRKSLMRFVTDQIVALQQNGTSPALSYADFDAHGDLAKLPANDVVGLHTFSLTDEVQFQHATWGIVVSTYDDPNLLVQNKITDWFYNRLRAHKQLKLYDPETGAVTGEIIVLQGTTTMPVERADTRAATFIQANAKAIETPV